MKFISVVILILSVLLQIPAKASWVDKPPVETTVKSFDGETVIVYTADKKKYSVKRSLLKNRKLIPGETKISIYPELLANK